MDRWSGMMQRRPRQHRKALLPNTGFAGPQVPRGPCAPACLLPDSFLHAMTCRKLDALAAKQALALTSRRSGDGRREPAVHDLATPVPRLIHSPQAGWETQTALQHVDRRHRCPTALPLDNVGLSRSGSEEAVPDRAAPLRPPWPGRQGARAGHCYELLIC